MVYLTEAERGIFVNRELELKKLIESAKMLKGGLRKNLSLIGMRKIGKTLLAAKFLEILEKKKNIKCILFNVENNLSTPEDFALRFAYSVLYSVNPSAEYEPSLSGLAKVSGEDSKEILELFLKESEKKVPNRILLIQKAFELPEKIAQRRKIYFFIVLDEFQAILGLNNYPNINILALIRKYFEHISRVEWIISGSAISLLLDKILSAKSPFFELFENIKIDFFDFNSTITLIEKIEKVYGAKIDRFIKRQVFSFTRGHPFYVYCLTDKICSLTKSPKISDLTRAIFEEVLTPGSRIYMHCRYIFDTSLERARGKTTLKKVLETLSKKEMSITEIAKETKMSIQAVNISLIRLGEVDLVERIGDKYRIVDTMLRFWINNVLLHGEEFVKIKEARMKQLEQELLKIKTELGIAKESEIREKLKEKFGIDFKKYKKSGIEFDAVAFNGRKFYIIEIKWKGRQIDVVELKKFKNKIEKSEFDKKDKKIIFISKSGFTKKAEIFAKENNIEMMYFVSKEGFL